MTMRRAMAAAALLASALSAPSVVSARAAIVTCDVLVLGADGLPVTDLAQRDFQILIDGVPAPIAQFGPAPTGISMVLMIDATMSQPLKRYEIHAAIANNWLPSLEAGDRARIGIVGGEIAIGPWLSPDRASNVRALRASVERAPTEPSPIWDAVDRAVTALAGTPGPRVIVLVTDGRSGGNALSLEDAAKRAIAGDVSISVISEGGEQLLPQGGDPATRLRPDASLRWLADATGGVYLEDGVARRTASPRLDPFGYVREVIDTPNRPGPLLSRILSVTRQRYRVGFTAAADRQVRTLEVRVSRPGLLVIAKRSYVAG
jgi:hypothetical protein